MSYILDALHKSEQDRQKKRGAPGLDALHRRVQPVRRNPWPFVAGFAALLSINAAVMYWWIVVHPNDVAAVQPPLTQSSPAIPASTAAPPETPTQPAPASRDSAGEGELITPSDYARRNPNPDRSATDTNPRGSQREVIAVSELPARVRQQIPELTFSSHIYASDADLKMVSINGERLREGDTVAPGLDLLEITEEGVVLGYETYRFEVSVLRGW